MTLRGKIDFAELTDTGRVREHNEDAIGSIGDIGLLVLADGMGGYNAGEVASGIAVQIVTNLAAEGATREERDDIDPHSGMMRQSTRTYTDPEQAERERVEFFLSTPSFLSRVPLPLPLCSFLNSEN